MNNQQLIEVFTTHPKHPIHLVVTSTPFARWLTLTAQPPKIGGRNWDQIRFDVLQALWEDWQRYRAQTIEVHL